MRIPRLEGVIRRRLLVNFRADPKVVERQLPRPFRPKLQAGFAVVGVCLIRLEDVRPPGLPAFLGISSENAAHRVAVWWPDAGGRVEEGVYILRRDSGSRLNQLVGGRLFPGVHQAARFAVADSGGRIELEMVSRDGRVAVRVAGHDSAQFPASSCFGSLAAASAFFEAGCKGYSAGRDPERSDGLLLQVGEWRVNPLATTEASSTYFQGEAFPAGSVQYDHTLIMRDVQHEWAALDDLAYAEPPESLPDLALGSASRNR
jgi:hypothetical protein